ncbi:extracellular solute-binding protein [Desertifilum sp. FACHB-1129]|uniref:ABC transporter substrate-binding protein n=1 Tax=Desertifilum tharense IPPAS B-1220 TaxID=1781255 RepID=A0A1E5QG70_9CYAN|nr:MULTISPECIES: extracellular solute-binding protein [Desertifilum]MDA0209297.1 extracellular solute-binding protein [Cyanobacteria bacterium FC1]MBD2314936.1 extracellular solute-binding protein [Desertifilum sp. FACHB-1129]MBD2325157.1 extracellular solute-binding protein [Desertifilum sp. FACHB-866]MBD2332701.1 extracellular solute-binding protein [Desertifilum sp. FACHB-868]OEJ73686.1 ABC transporter substrate-binding protein [Desertifilum tharense IPPAS B-1220]
MARITRRTLLRIGLAAGSMLTATQCTRQNSQQQSVSGGPTVLTNQTKDVTLRFIGTGVSQINEVGQKAQEDLGFKIQTRALSTDENNQIAITQPRSYDIFDGEYFSLPLVIPSGNLQPIDIRRIRNWDKIVPYFTTGQFKGGSPVNTSQGTAPFKVMYLTGPDSTTFSSTPTDYATLIPFQYNADTLGYRPDLVGRTIESWGELFNPEFRGKTSILDIASIGIMDAAMVIEALGLMTFQDKGNMTPEELDKVTQILVEQKRQGQFRAFWKNFDESVNLMASGEVIVQSMWSPAVTQVKARGVNCVYAPLKEGYRGWGGGIGLSKNLSGIALDAAYEYLNWTLEGWLGAFLGRQGYYSAAPELARNYMSPEEWDFWYEGKPAAADMVDPFGKTLEKQGAIRDGGSFEERFGNIVCWNSVMSEQRYLVQKWNEFVSA